VKPAHERQAAAPAIPRASPAALLAAGRRAFREIPGLRRLLVKGFVLLYGTALLTGAVGVGGLYYYIVRPLAAGLEGWGAGEGFWMAVLAAILAGLLWFGQFLLLAATVAVSLLIAVSLMSLWFESLAARIIAHHRGEAAVQERPFRVGVWLRGLGRALADSSWLVMLSLLALLLGFVPLIGPLLVVLVESYLLGREVRDPYLSVRASLGEEPGRLRCGLALWTILTGLLPFVLAMVPVAGWLLLPAAMIHLVAGFAWQAEVARAGTAR
jgi:uncharacterized protein involved in cysteine biosynthesis